MGGETKKLGLTFLSSVFYIYSWKCSLCVCQAMLELKGILFNGDLFRREVFAKPFLGNLVWFIQDKPAVKFVLDSIQSTP